MADSRVSGGFESFSGHLQTSLILFFFFQLFLIYFFRPTGWVLNPLSLFLPLLSLVLTQAESGYGETFTTRTEITDSTGTFTKCTFNGCRSAENGGAINVESKTSLVVNNCTFDKCISTSSSQGGGAISCAHSETFIVQNTSKFSDCWAEKWGGGICAWNISTCFFIHSSEISKCYTNSHDGGGIYLALCPSTTVASTCKDREVEREDGLLYDLTIKECNATRWGGGFMLHFPEEGFSVCSCNITGCEAEMGGGVYVWFFHNFAACNPIFKSCYFERNAASKGHDLYCDPDRTTTYWNDHSTGVFEKSTCFTRTPFLYGKNYVSYNEIAIDDKWLPFAVYISPSFSPDSGCGHGHLSYEACESIEAGMKEERFVTENLPVVLLFGRPHTALPSNPITIGDGKSRKVWGEEYRDGEEIQNYAVLNVRNLQTGSTLFSIQEGGALEIRRIQFEVSTYSAASFAGTLFESSGELSLEVVSITTDPSKTEMTVDNSLIKVASGKTQFTSVSFSSIKLSGCPLIEWRSGTLSTEGTTFDSISRSSGNGAVVELDASTGLTFSIANTTCTGCGCTNGNGGAIAGTLNVGTINIGKSGLSTSFSSCTATRGGAVFLDLQSYTNYQFSGNPFGSGNSANGKGNNLYLSTSDTSCITPPKLNNLGTTSDNGNVDYCFSDASNSSNPIHDVPIWVLFSTASNPLYVNSSSTDYVKCGFETFPCKTLTYIVSTLRKGAVKDIRIVDSSSYDSLSTSETQTMTIQGPSSLPYPTINIVDSESYPASGNVSLRYLCFAVPEERSDLFSRSGDSFLMDCCTINLPGSLKYSVWSVSSGSLTLSTIEFSSSARPRLSAPLLSCSGSGSATISSTTISDLSCSSSSLLSLLSSDSSLTLESSMHISSITLDGNPLILFTSGSLVSKGVEFKTITRSSGDGAVLELSPAESTTLNTANTTCTGCGCTNGNGGAIAGTLNGGTINIGGSEVTTSFSSCSAMNGKGGGIYLTVGASDSYKLESVQFGDGENGNSAQHGKNVYIVSSSPSTAITSTNFDVTPAISWETRDEYQYTDATPGNTEAENIPIAALFAGAPSSIIVSQSESGDAPICGHSQYPCKTLNYAVSSKQLTTTKTVSINDGQNYSTPTAWPGTPVIVTGHAPTHPTLYIPDDADYSLSASASFASLSFSLPLTLSSSSLFSSSSPSLNLSSLAILLPDTLSYSLFSFSGSSTLTLSSVKIHPHQDVSSSSSSSSSSLFSLDGAATLFINGDENEFSSLTFTAPGASLFSPSQSYSGTISVSSTKFSSLSASSSSSSPSSLLSPSFSPLSLSLRNATFTDCTSPQSTEGGAIYFCLSSSASFSAVNTTAQSCKCNEERGKGGWLFIEAVDSSLSPAPTAPFPLLSLTLSGITFTENVASAGKDVFVHCFSLSQVDKDSFVTEPEDDNGVVVCDQTGRCSPDIADPSTSTEPSDDPPLFFPGQPDRSAGLTPLSSSALSAADQKLAESGKTKESKLGVRGGILVGLFGCAGVLLLVIGFLFGCLWTMERAIGRVKSAVKKEKLRKERKEEKRERRRKRHFRKEEQLDERLGALASAVNAASVWKKKALEKKKEGGREKEGSRTAETSRLLPSVSSEYERLEEMDMEE